jgi:hypothetical protein
VQIASLFFAIVISACIKSISPLPDPTEITETSEYICGVGALVAGITVAFKQVAPEHKLAVFKLVDIPLRLVPLALNIGHMCMWAVGLITQSHFTLYLCGTLVSFVYLRFYKHADSVFGDRSETFAFHTLFPEALGYIRYTNNGLGPDL